MTRFAFGLLAICLVRWLGIVCFRRAGRWKQRSFQALMAAGAVVTALLWSGLAVSSLLALGLAGPSMLLMIVLVGSSYGALVVWAPFPHVALTVVACFLAPPLVTSLMLEDPESRVLAIILFALALFSIGLVHNLNRSYWIGVERLRDTRAALAEAERANSAKTDFLANVSHEIRTPMVGIVGPAEMLSRSRPSPDQKRQIDLILSSARVLGNLIDTLLDVAKIEAGEIRVDVSRFDLRRAFAAVADRHRAKAEGKGLALILDLEGVDEPWIVGDDLRIGQVVDNLLSNAVKFTEHGEVRLAATLTPGPEGAAVLAFRVEDTGPGIPALAHDDVFRPFRQLDSSVSRRYGGTGLGLTISKGLVELMKGAIEIEQRPQGGTRFLVTLPVALAAPPEDEALAQGAVPGPTPSLSGRRVLVAEDDPVSQLVIRQMLTVLGLVVEVVANGEEALEAASRHAFDLVLLDCQMPVLDGFATARKLRERLRGEPLPILALTAHAFEVDRHRALDAGMDDHLRKPLSLQELQSALERWIRA